MPTLYVYSGLPGTGKTTLAKRLSQHFLATYLRIFAAEQAMRDLFDIQLKGEGYSLSYRIAGDNL